MHIAGDKSTNKKRREKKDERKRATLPFSHFVYDERVWMLRFGEIERAQAAEEILCAKRTRESFV